MATFISSIIAWTERKGFWRLSEWAGKRRSYGIRRPATAQPTSFATTADGRTTVPLKLDPYGSTFVVFRAPAAKNAVELPAPKETVIDGLDLALNRDWSVSFQQGKGIPETIDFDHLVSWTDLPLPAADEALKYFSGTATYSKTIDIPADDISAGRASLARSRRRARPR